MLSTQTRTATRQPTTLVGQVLGLLAFSMLFTAAGAYGAPLLGARALPIGALGGLITWFVLFLAPRLAPPLRLGIFYLFSIFQGITLGVVVNSYIAAGRGDVVVLAAGVTAGLVFVLAAYAWTTRRNLLGLGSYLFIGLIGVLIAAIAGFFIRAPIFHLAVAAATAILFSGYLLYHVQRLKTGTGSAIGLAIGIYIDIYNLFMSILRILSHFTGRSR